MPYFDVPLDRSHGRVAEGNYATTAGFATSRARSSKTVYEVSKSLQVSPSLVLRSNGSGESLDTAGLPISTNSLILARMKSILEQVLSEARLKPHRFLVIFDLDSTLFDLAPRILRIIEEFAALETTQKNYPDECAKLRAMEVLKEDWGIAEGLIRLGMRAEDSKEFWHAIHTHWAQNFFSSDFLQYDSPLAGAVEYVNELASTGAEIVYLTGRDVPRMFEGTERSLRETGFPSARLVLKPSADLDDAEFKVQFIRDLLPQYDRIWLFENEPVNTNLVARECPAVQIVFVDTTHSRREEVDPSHSKIADFESWTRQVKA